MKDYKNPIYATMKMARANLSRIADNIYQQGYEAGKAATPFTDTKEAEDKAYERGLNDAWELVKKIINDENNGGYVFGYRYLFEVVDNYTASEALTKIREYEDKQKQDTKIKVGDEIRLHDAIEVVTSVMSTGLQTIDASGNTSTWYYNTYPLETWEKTGRHFPQIAEILAELRGAENDTRRSN